MTDEFVEDLFKGIGVIIDDDIKDNTSKVYNMVCDFREHGVPVVEFDSIPSEMVIDSLQSISFAILDWEFKKKPVGFDLETDLGGVLGNTLQEEQRQTILSFLHKLLEKTFLPVFIITGQNYGDVKAQLEEAGLYSEKKPTRIMLQRKTAITGYNAFIHEVSSWLEDTPSALALKIWEKEAVRTKNKMFLELYNASPNWVRVLLRSMKNDSRSKERTVNHEFNELLNNNFMNRMNDGPYSLIEFKGKGGIEQEEIRKVLQGEKYIEYNKDDLPEIALVGDIYKSNKGEDYYLNIRAQCNTIRENDPALYLIKGKEMDVSELTKPFDITIKTYNKENYLEINRASFPLNELATAGKIDQRTFRQWVLDMERFVVFQGGDIIEKKTEAIVACVDNKYLIRFGFKDLIVTKKSRIEKRAKRIGRLIPPYITKIQRNYTSYMIREGLMALPKELFNL